MTLYHVSPESNTNSIKKHGVNPYKSRGKQFVSWWVEWDALLWAIAHVSARHKVSVAQITVWAAPENAIGMFSRTRWVGVYTLDYTILAHYHYRAQDMVEALKPAEPISDKDIPF